MPENLTEIVLCGSCGCAHEDTDPCYNGYCDDCRKLCDNCNNYHCNEHDYCDSCARTCAVCDDIHCDRAEELCPGCRDEHHIPEDGDDYYHEDRLHYRDSDGTWWLELPEKIIYGHGSYGESKDMTHRGLAANGLHVGWELEIMPKKHDFSDDFADCIKDCFPLESYPDSDLHLDADSSLCYDSDDGDDVNTDTGVELVSGYCAIDASIAYGKKIIGKLPSCAISHDSGVCGLHVHLSRKFFTELGLGRFICFWNLPENVAYLSAIARRWNGYFCRWDPKKTDPKNVPTSIGGTKYVNVNLQHTSSIELRVFRGTLNRKTFEVCLLASYWSAVFCVETEDDFSFRNFMHFLAGREPAAWHKVNDYLTEKLGSQSFVSESNGD